MLTLSLGGSLRLRFAGHGEVAISEGGAILSAARLWARPLNQTGHTLSVIYPSAPIVAPSDWRSTDATAWLPQPGARAWVEQQRGRRQREAGERAIPSADLPKQPPRWAAGGDEWTPWKSERKPPARKPKGQGGAPPAGAPPAAASPPGVSHPKDAHWRQGPLLGGSPGWKGGPAKGLPQWKSDLPVAWPASPRKPG